MSDDMKPEVLPGDLITGPGLYEARNGDIVRIVEHDGAWWVCECDGKRDWYHNDGTRRFKSTDSDRWKLVRWIGPLPDDDPTTSEQIAEIEGQAAYTPPEGWRVLAVGEKLQLGDMTVRSDGYCYSTERVGYYVGLNQRYIRRIEPEPEPQPEPQPVQVREGRWRTRVGEIRHVTRTPDKHELRDEFPWWDASNRHTTWRNDGRYSHERQSMFDLLEYLGPIQPEPEGSCPQLHPWLRTPPEQKPDRTLTPDDVAAEALAGVWDQAKAEQQIAELQAQVEFLKGRLQEEKAKSAKRLDQIQELRSEVSHVQRLWGESRRRVEDLEQKLAESQTVVVQQQNLIQNRLTTNEAAEPEPQPEASPVHLQVMIEAQAETIARLNSEIHGLSIQNAELLAQLEAVKADLVRQCENSRLLQIELDAREQVPQAVSDRFEQGWDAGNARAVETIAEWLEPFRTCGSQALALAVLQNLPHIMRTLTGLTEED